MPKDWERFEGYAHLIRSISLPDLHNYRAICTRIAQTQPPGTVLFRNLHTLRFSAHDINDDLLHYTQFMVPSIMTLELKLTGRESVELSSAMKLFFGCIASRLQHLRSLSISLAVIKSHPVLFIGLLARTLEGLKNLEYVVLPPCLVVGKVITSLSRHPHLVEINPAYGSLAMEAYSMASCSTSSPELTDISFPSLSAISLCTIPRSAHALLANPYFPANQISRIHVQVFSQRHRRGEREPFELLMRTIAGNCTNIEDVTITEFKRPNDNNDLVLSYRSIREILRCTRITSLKIDFRGCLPWTVQDLNEFASFLPAATTLMLNQAPFHPTLPTVRIEAVLSAFSRHCLLLQELGFYFDARSQPGFSEGSSECLSVPRFRSLAVLHVGSSPITDSSQNVVDITAFLIAVLPARCKLRWVRKSDEFNAGSSDVDTGDESSVSSMEDDNCAWQRVGQLRDLHSKAPRPLLGAPV
ncbi:hypothetical protein Hypma_006372 [Hypsizygus marmoreus]|uniref:F-box domain-containing protein n=1 Tax=Hypsizygus marmoreus TaxID=39966 RepID=A0A369K4B0_HYPMA|nr:hypothetical protein Hypma_006372 [Hypsizygus marmoreus]